MGDLSGLLWRELTSICATQILTVDGIAARIVVVIAGAAGNRIHLAKPTEGGVVIAGSHLVQPRRVQVTPAPAPRVRRQGAVDAGGGGMVAIGVVGVGRSLHATGIDQGDDRPLAVPHVV